MYDFSNILISIEIERGRLETTSLISRTPKQDGDNKITE